MERPLLEEISDFAIAVRKVIWSIVNVVRLFRYARVWIRKTRRRPSDLARVANSSSSLWRPPEIRRLVMSSILLVTVVTVFKSDSLDVDSSSTGHSLRLYAERGTTPTTQLSDGTQLLVVEGSDVTVNYTSDRRRVELRDGALGFRIAADSGRQFEIWTATAFARTTAAIVDASFRRYRGTSFTVAPTSSGDIELWYRGRRDWKSLFKSRPLRRVVLRAGQNVEIRFSGDLILGRGNFNAADLPEQRIEFLEVRLATVLEDLNRFYTVPLILNDPELEALEITGNFNIYDRATLIEFLKDYCHVSVEAAPDGSLVLFRQRA